MICELPSPIRGNTHVDLQEAFFSLKEGLAYCRGVLGTATGDVFTEDPDIRPFYVAWEGVEFAALTDSLDSTALVAAAQAKSWGYATATP